MADIARVVSASDRIAAAFDRDHVAAYAAAIESRCETISASSERLRIALVGFEAAIHLDTALRWATEVIIVEQDPSLLAGLQDSLSASHSNEKVRWIGDDPMTMTLDSLVDLVVIASASPWFLDDTTASLWKTLSGRILRPGGECIPRQAAHLLELVTQPPGAPSAARTWMRRERRTHLRTALSEPKVFEAMALPHDAPPSPWEDTIIVKPLFDGTVTGLRLTTMIELIEGVVLHASSATGDAIYLPLEQPTAVRAGQPTELWIRTHPGNGQARAKARTVDVPPTDERSWRDGDIGQVFFRDIQRMIATVDQTGRGADLDRIVGYSLDPKGDVSRLTALFWTIDEEFRVPLRDIVASLRERTAKASITPDDETIYELMLEAYRDLRSAQAGDGQ